MTEKDWKEILLSRDGKLTSYQRDLLINGPHSLAQSWMLNALYVRYKKKYLPPDPPPPNLQSSYKEFSEKTNQEEDKNQ